MYQSVGGGREKHSQLSVLQPSIAAQCLCQLTQVWQMVSLSTWFRFVPQFVTNYGFSSKGYAMHNAHG